MTAKELLIGVGLFLTFLTMVLIFNLNHEKFVKERFITNGYEQVIDEETSKICWKKIKE